MVTIPEWSSLTSDDTVLVMESAATRRSFLRFLLEPGPEERSHTLKIHFNDFQQRALSPEIR